MAQRQLAKTNKTTKKQNKKQITQKADSGEGVESVFQRYYVTRLKQAVFSKKITADIKDAKVWPI